MMKEEKDSNKPNSFLGAEWVGQVQYGRKNPRIWDKEEWY